MKDQLIALLLKNVNVSGIFVGLIDELRNDALLKVVDDTANPIDDTMMAVLYPVLSIEIKELVLKKLDEVLADL